MTHLPSELAEGLDETGLLKAYEWWDGLADGCREEILQLCIPHLDSCQVRSKQLTILVDSELLCDEDDTEYTEYTEDWADFFDYMLGHPEIFPPFEPLIRLFHIGCLYSKHGGHLIAEAASPGFSCPFNSPICPLRR